MCLDLWQSLRSRIAASSGPQFSGKLQAGATLPPARALAAQFGTAESNVHRALTVLVKERAHQQTTPQRDCRQPQTRRTSSHRVAVYLARDAMHPANAFSRCLSKNLEEELAAIGAECLGVIQENREGAGLAQLNHLAKTRQIQGIVAPHDWTKEALTKPPVPLAVIDSSRSSARIDLDFESIAELAALALQRQGCKSAGFLCRPGERQALRRIPSRVQTSGRAPEIELRPNGQSRPRTRRPSPMRRPSARFAFDGFAQIGRGRNGPTASSLY